MNGDVLATDPFCHGSNGLLFDAMTGWHKGVTWQLSHDFFILDSPEFNPNVPSGFAFGEETPGLAAVLILRF